MTDNTLKLVQYFRERGKCKQLLARILIDKLERAEARAKVRKKHVTITVRPVCAGLLPATTGR